MIPHDFLVPVIINYVPKGLTFKTSSFSINIHCIGISLYSSISSIEASLATCGIFSIFLCPLHLPYICKTVPLCSQLSHPLIFFLSHTLSLFLNILFSSLSFFGIRPDSEKMSSKKRSIGKKIVISQQRIKYYSIMNMHTYF